MSYRQERPGVMRRMLAAVGIGRDRTLALPSPEHFPDSDETAAAPPPAPGYEPPFVYAPNSGKDAGDDLRDMIEGYDPAAVRTATGDAQRAAAASDGSPAPAESGPAPAAPVTPPDELGEQLRRVRRVLEENDPLAPKPARRKATPPPPPPPVRERVSLTVRLETPIDSDVLAGSPGRPSRIAEATLAQLPPGARIVGLVVETYVD